MNTVSVAGFGRVSGPFRDCRGRESALADSRSAGQSGVEVE